MILASAPLKNGRNDYVFNIAATPRRAPGGNRRGRAAAFEAALDPFSALIRDCGVVSPAAPRPAKPAWADAQSIGFAGAVLAAVVLVYLPALTGGFLWDDDAHVTRQSLRSLHGLWRIWFEPGATQQYYPLLHSAFWVEHRLWGDSVLGYHLLNVILHAAAAWLLFAILRGMAFPVPRLAALLFALHPVCVESVAWISEQKNTLSAVFYLLSALAYLRFDGNRRKSLYLGALALFILALLTKTVTATLPAALLVIFWWRRGRLGWKRDVLPLVPWFATGLAIGLRTAWVERTLIGAEGADFSFTAAQRIVLAGKVVVFYLHSLVWPAHLMFIYPRWTLDASSGADWLSLGGVIVLVAVLGAIARTRRGPLAGFLIFAGTLFPALGFFNVYPFLFSFVADHFQYLASLGIIVPAAWGLGWLAGRLAAGAAGRACLMMALPVLLGALSWRQAGIYRDTETLYRATLARNPGAWLIHFNLAVTLGMGPEHIAEAISEYQATVRLKPDHWRAHNNLASALLKLKGRSGDAISEYQEALRYNPNYAEAHNNLAIALEDVPGRVQEAIGHLRAAIRIRPDYDAAHSNLGSLLMRDPRMLGEAAAELEAAVRIAPDIAEYHYYLGNALSLEPGRLADAVAQYRAALALKPAYAEAHSNLGVALAHMPGRVPDAISEYRAALALDPGSPEIHANLANALSNIPGGAAEAIAEYSAALRIDPSDALIHCALGVLLAKEPGRLQDAVSEFEAAVRLNPTSAEAHYSLAIGLAMTGGRRDEAIGHLRRALELRPDFARARAALEHMRATGP
jgi:tetratricopeptide (TPR) repeat protein